MHSTSSRVAVALALLSTSCEAGPTVNIPASSYVEVLHQVF